MSGRRQKNQQHMAFCSPGQVKLASTDREEPERLRRREKPKARQEAACCSAESLTDSNRRIRNRTYGGVGGADEQLSPLSRSTITDGLSYGAGSAD